MKPVILLKPTPTELDAQLRSERDIARHRRLYCPHYDRCLDESIRRNWVSFSCVHCPLEKAAANLESQSKSFAVQRQGNRFSE